MNESVKSKSNTLLTLPTFEFSDREAGHLDGLLNDFLEKSLDQEMISDFERSIDVAFILSEEVNLGKVSILSLLAHFLLSYKFVSLDEIETIYGLQVVSIVKGLQKAKELNIKDQAFESENYRKLLLTIVEDIRVVIILICNQLYKMRRLQNRHSCMPLWRTVWGYIG